MTTEVNSTVRRALATLTAVALAASTVSTRSAELIVDDGVVIKFGGDAQLVLRDKLTAGQGVVLTSQKDDGNGGQTGAAAQVPAAGDWRGLRLEKSAAAFGPLSLSDWTVRYAGGGDAGAAGAAVTLRGFSPGLQYLQVMDGTTGLRLLDGASPAISGSSFLRNAIGLDADGNSAPIIGSTQFAGNTTQAILNRTPATLIQATGNWWGHPSGPKDAAGNPQGQGDAVSAGVNYANPLALAPLIAPSVRLASPLPFYEGRTVTLDVACINATEFRIAEGTAFAGTSFQSLANGRATVDFMTKRQADYAKLVPKKSK